MIKQIKNKLSRKNKKGFTLIELIVVIAIVAVLAAVGIPAIAGQVSKANQSSLDSNAKLIAEQGQIMITQKEAAGGDYSAISGITDTEIIKAAGIDTAKAGTIVILRESVDINSNVTTVAADMISQRIKEVTVTKDGKVGKFTRV